MLYTFKMLKDEFWYGGGVNDGTAQPFSEKSDFSCDHRCHCVTQGMPFFLSSKGRYIWSEDAFAISFKNGAISIESDLEVKLVQVGSNLREAYLAAMRAHFPFSGKMPREEFFKTAQYNSWMEFTYNPTQDGILQYAHAIIDNGFQPGILIIDEGWHKPYGDWTFDKLKFPNPKEMIDELHSLGFTVMLWVVPFVTCSGLKYINTVAPYLNKVNAGKYFMRNEKGEVALTEWWNGITALLDFTSEENREFLESQLRALMQDFGVDGFKFDGGSKTTYHNVRLRNGSFRGTTDGTYSPLRQNMAWIDFGSKFDFHEFKDIYKGGGKPIISRLMDRNHNWNENGINTIIPNSLIAGLTGYPFICPDMIGGGEWTENHKPDAFDEELFIRMAQSSVFFPMMQFSWAPWRVLSPRGFEIVKGCAKLHCDMAQEIIAIIRESAKSGEPVLRHLEYEFPGCGYESIFDEFMCGSDILVCPIVTKGTFEKEVVIPDGKWIDELGNIFEGGRHIIPTPVERLPYFRRIK